MLLKFRLFNSHVLIFTIFCQFWLECLLKETSLSIICDMAQTLFRTYRSLSSFFQSSMVLTEIKQQVLARHIQEVAQLYPPSLLALYQDAANNFRLPYWDWAVNPDIPSITTIQNIQIETPDGLTTIRNPLYSYRFPPLNQNQFPPNQDSGLGTYSETVRQSVNTINSRLRTEDFQRRTVCCT